MYCCISAVPMNSGSYPTQPGVTVFHAGIERSYTQLQSLDGSLETTPLYPVSAYTGVVAGQHAAAVTSRSDITSYTAELATQQTSQLSIDQVMCQCTSYQGHVVHDNLLEAAQPAQYHPPLPAQLDCTELSQSQALYAPVAAPAEPAQAAVQPQHALMQLQAVGTLQLQNTPHWQTWLTSSTPTLTRLTPHAHALQQNPLSEVLQLPSGAQLQQQQQLLQDLGQSCWQSITTAVAGADFAATACIASTAVQSTSSSASEFGAAVSMWHGTIRGHNGERSSIRQHQAVVTTDQQSCARLRPSAVGSISSSSDFMQQQRQSDNNMVASDFSSGVDSMSGPVTQHRQDMASKAASSHKCSKVYGAQQTMPQAPTTRSAQPAAGQGHEVSCTAPLASPAAVSEKLLVTTEPVNHRRNSLPASAAADGIRQQVQRTTGLSHRQRFRRKQWELQRATEQQRMQKQQQALKERGCQKMQGLHASWSDNSLASSTATRLIEHCDVRPVVAASNTQATSNALQPVAEDITTFDADVSQGTTGTPTTAACNQNQQHEPSAALPVGITEADYDLDVWLSKLLEL